MANVPAHFASSGGGGGRYDGSDDDYYDDVDDEPAQSTRRDASQPTAARRRTVQSEPDDRYWTDYLRIALPVIGLLLVIAVFWFWAQELIDDRSDEDPTATQPGIAEVADTELNGSEGDESVDVGTPETADPNTADQGEQSAPPTSVPTDGQGQNVALPSPTSVPAQEQEEAVAPPEDAGSQVEDVLAGLTAPASIEPDMIVVVNDNVVNVRSEASTAGGETTIIDTLDTGDTLTTVSGPVDADGFTWWEVRVDATGEVGWVVQDYIDPAS